jgi:hypothetical protein
MEGVSKWKADVCLDKQVEELVGKQSICQNGNKLYVGGNSDGEKTHSCVSCFIRFLAGG